MEISRRQNSKRYRRKSSDRMNTEIKNKEAQPFLRWAGSKKKILPQLSEYYGKDYKRYVEPFAGSASLFFKLNPKRAILGDINNDLISTYREIKYRLPRVSRELGKLKKGKRRYYQLRSLDVATLSPAQRAARFIYLNRFCFNGLYRTNMKGLFNVPYGGEKAGNIPSDDALSSCAKVLKKVRLVSGDFAKTIKCVKPGDFVYMDPPFSTKSKRVFTEYDKTIFGEADVKRLRKWMEFLALKKIDFVVSFADCNEGDYLKKDFYSKIISVNRQIAGFASNRTSTKELLISSFPPKHLSRLI